MANSTPRAIRGCKFDGRALETSGLPRDREAFAAGGGWISIDRKRCYVRFAGSGAAADSYTWEVVEVAS